MKTTFSILFLILVTANISAQSSKTTTIVYEQYENKKLDTTKKIIVTCNKNQASIINPSNSERYYIDYLGKNVIKTSQKEIPCAVNTSFDSLSQASFTEDKDTILGYVCKKATFNVFSNKIQVWYTNTLTCRASPSISFSPVDGVVLKYVVNGNRTLLAKTISLSEEAIILPGKEYNRVDEPTYLANQIKSKYIRIPVFEKEQINFENDIQNKSSEERNYTYRYAKGNVILKKIKLPKNNSKGLFFIQLTEWSNGDAYDRVGSVFTFSTKTEKNILLALQKGVDILPVYQDKNRNTYQGIVATEIYAPAIELMRFFTPFGVGYFNKKRLISGYTWSDSAVYKQEVSSLIPTDEDEIWIGVYIGNYDKGGHKVSLELNFYPEPEMDEVHKWITPLFSTVNLMEAAGQNYGKLFQNDTLQLFFNVPDSIADMKILFTTTGHGGWDTGDEFLPKLNQLTLDGKPIFSHTPWRSDCGTYRLLNPASGNFPDGLSSSDFSRSNWCPGTLSPPFVIPIKSISKGRHSIQVIIDQGKPEGDSFSHWCVSGVIVGIKK